MEQRFVNKEFTMLKRLTAFISELLYMKEDLDERMQIIPDGQKRLDNVLSEVSDLVKELIETGPDSQKKQLYNFIKDSRVELIPKLSPGSTNILMSKAQAKQLVDIAQEKCKSCVEDPRSAKNCVLYKVLEVTALPDTYNTLLCPYSRAKWED